MVFQETAAKVAISFFSQIKIFDMTAFGHLTEVHNCKTICVEKCLSYWNPMTLFLYSRNIRENLPQPIQMLLPKKPKTFCQGFIGFLKST